MRVATFGAKLEKGIELTREKNYDGQSSRKKIELTIGKNYVGQDSRKKIELTKERIMLDKVVERSPERLPLATSTVGEVCGKMCHEKCVTAFSNCWK